MRRFLIVRATDRVGRGTRGGNLHRFLRIHAGRRAVEIVSVEELASGSPRETDLLFIGMPTTLGPVALAKVKFRRACLFDYGDRAGPDWRGADEAFLRSITDRYLKAWVEEDWDFGLRWGVLPIRRYPGLTWHVRVLRRLTARYPEVVRRDHDVSFLGNATSYFGTDGTNRYAQRVEWLAELYGARDRLAFWGGLQAPEHDRVRLRERYGDVDHLFFDGRIPYPLFFHHLLRSKIVLAPTGNARWSYRHYEAIYAGALVVSTDLRRVRLLMPLPAEGMVQVPDHEPLLPAVDRALGLLARDPGLPARNLEFLETYLADGDYSPARPRLMADFLSQLPDP